jgi:hypothetical protein
MKQSLWLIVILAWCLNWRASSSLRLHFADRLLR